MTGGGVGEVVTSAGVVTAAGVVTSAGVDVGRTTGVEELVIGM